MTLRRFVLRVQMLAAIVGLVSCLWLDDVRAAEDGKADVVLRHGKIYTADPTRSIGQSIAFTGNSVVAIGDDDKVKLLIGPATRVVDLGGKLVLPGLIDTHTHPIDGAINGTKCNLADVGGGKPPTVEALRPVIRDCLDKEPGDEDDWLEAVQLFNYGFEATARDLDDRIEKNRPIALEGNDGHTMWVNSHGLKLLKEEIEALRKRNNACGISRKPGLVFDGVGLVEEKMSCRKRVSLTAAVLKDMSANGITSLMDARVGPAEEDVWLLLYRIGRPDMRVRMALNVDDFVDEPYRDIGKTVERLVTKSNEVNDGTEGDVDPNFLRAGVVKVYADDVMECPSQTAALLSPYLDADGKKTQYCGELGFAPKKFADLVTKLDAKGLAMLKAGAMIVGGSDWDVSSYNPFCAFQTAVTRRGEKNQEQERGEKEQGKEPLNIEEKISLNTAVDAYTINAAFALKQEATTGSLEVGKRADLIVLDRDIFSIESDTIADTKVLMTYLDGRLVYTAPANGTSRMQRCDKIYN
jgi:predicted amidohydrolase YtcJ